MASLYVTWALKNINKGENSHMIAFITEYVLYLWHKHLQRPSVK